jgi:hypothetical protein
MSEAAEPLPATASAIHLDTTLQIEGLKSQRQRQAVARGLKSYTFRSTSTYARYEFNRTIIRDLTYLHAICHQVQTLAEVYQRVQASFGPSKSSRNRLTRILELLTRFLEDRPQNMQVRSELTRLRSHVAVMLLQGHVVWDRSVTHEFNGTECVLASVRPRLAPNGSVIFALHKCKPSRIRCRVHKFYESRASEFNKIANVASALGPRASQQLQRANGVLDRAAVDPTVLCDDSTCAKIGDAIIAVDGVSVPVFGANNDDDWVPISTALSKKLVNPVRDSASERSESEKQSSE